MSESLKKRYVAIREHGAKKALPPYVDDLSRQWAEGLYDAYTALLDAVPGGFRGRRVLDFGCKCGHLAPMLFERGASKVIGVDAELPYIEAARATIGELYPDTEFQLTHEGLIELQPESADLILMNEVISHVNPSFLDTVFREAARILAPGGMLFISDGNNAAHPPSVAALEDLYDKWENGPEGARTDRDVVEDAFLNLRREVLRKTCPELPAERLEILAQNTSGLFGAQLEQVAREYARTGHLIRRPYRKGLCPVNPGASGVVMERAFHPVQLELWLREYGLDARQVEPRPSFARRGVLGPLKSVYAAVRYYGRRLANRNWYRSAYGGFMIAATRAR